MKRILSRIGMTGAGLVIAMSSVAGLSASALTQSHNSADSNDPSTFIAPLHSLNNSGVTGMARLSLNDTQPGAELTASVNARGAEPTQVHPIHMHGSLDGIDAECPNISADTNNDRIVSVFEGAPFYGPIKISFTTPPTTFGPPSRTDLFAPFAGVPVTNNFPFANIKGRIQYNQNIPFDVNNQFAVQALNSIIPLSSQHIVIHGGYAPESVDTPGGSKTKIVYDALLPVACGSIIQTHRGSTKSNDKKDKSDADASSTGITGPGSTNSVTNNSTNTVETTNINDIRSSSNSTQTATSGHAHSHHNTTSGGTNSGSATTTSGSSSSAGVTNR